MDVQLEIFEITDDDDLVIDDGQLEDKIDTAQVLGVEDVAVEVFWCGICGNILHQVLIKSFHEEKS